MLVLPVSMKCFLLALMLVNILMATNLLFSDFIESASAKWKRSWKKSVQVRKVFLSGGVGSECRGYSFRALKHGSHMQCKCKHKCKLCAHIMQMQSQGLQCMHAHLEVFFCHASLACF